MVVVMMGLALEMHHGVLVLPGICHHHGDTRMGQRLPAHAEDQDEGREATAHGQQFSGGNHTPWTLVIRRWSGRCKVRQLRAPRRWPSDAEEALELAAVAALAVLHTGVQAVGRPLQGLFTATAHAGSLIHGSPTRRRRSSRTQSPWTLAGERGEGGSLTGATSAISRAPPIGGLTRPGSTSPFSSPSIPR